MFVYPRVMTSVPVLLICFTRTERVERLIESLRPHRPQTVRVVIDGPRPQVPADSADLESTARALEKIDWTEDVRVHRHPRNLGPRGSIPWAVSWVLSEFPETIVIEDDVTVGPQFLEFAATALRLWRDDPQTFCISGYNLVPASSLTSPELPARYSSFSSSYAWATWRRAWEFFDPEMTWFSSQSLGQLTERFGSVATALRWRQFSSLVRRQLVNTWDYQWLMSIWSQNGRAVMPNHNLVEYHGISGGTHTVRRRAWDELPVVEIDMGRLSDVLNHDKVDATADTFLQRNGHRSTPIGVMIGYLEGPAMQSHKIWKSIRRS